MRTIFEDPARRKKLIKVCDSWIGTPFRHKAAVKGRGCDCVNFVVEVFREAGIANVDGSMFPDYPYDWNLHQDKELILDGLRARDDIMEIPRSEARTGDLVLFQYGRAASHLAIYADNGFAYQSLNGVGVVKLPLNDRSTRGRLRHVFRVMEKES